MKILVLLALLQVSSTLAMPKKGDAVANALSEKGVAAGAAMSKTGGDAAANAIVSQLWQYFKEVIKLTWPSNWL